VKEAKLQNPDAPRNDWRAVRINKESQNIGRHYGRDKGALVWLQTVIDEQKLIVLCSLLLRYPSECLKNKRLGILIVFTIILAAVVR
jgi:hypothetical protein